MWWCFTHTIKPQEADTAVATFNTLIWTSPAQAGLFSDARARPGHCIQAWAGQPLRKVLLGKSTFKSAYFQKVWLCLNSVTFWLKLSYFTMNSDLKKKKWYHVFQVLLITKARAHNEKLREQCQRKNNPRFLKQHSTFTSRINSVLVKEV